MMSPIDDRINVFIKQLLLQHFFDNFNPSWDVLPFPVTRNAVEVTFTSSIKHRKNGNCKTAR